MSKQTYKDMDKFYKTKRRLKKKYYEQTKNAINGRKPYTEEEIELIMSHTMTDRELSLKLGRSMKAIQRKRYEIKSKQ